MSPVLAAFSLLAGVIVACTGDDPVTSDGPERGQLGGECLSNGSCNAGLACTLVDGKARCANVTTGNEAGALTDSGGNNDDDSGRPRCNFAATPSVCPEKVACYVSLTASTFPEGGAEEAGTPPPSSCIEPANDCSDGELRWECNSPHYACGSCCITGELITAAQQCSEAKLKPATGKRGTSCVTDKTCQPGKLQLCQSNNQCPDGQHCSPVRILSDYTVNDTVLGVCVP